MKRCKLCYTPHDGLPSEPYCADCQLDLTVMEQTVRRRRLEAMTAESYDNGIMVAVTGEMVIICGTCAR
jgi:hypothetical protein